MPVESITPGGSARRSLPVAEPARGAASSAATIALDEVGVEHDVGIERQVEGAAAAADQAVVRGGEAEVGGAVAALGGA